MACSAPHSLPVPLLADGLHLGGGAANPTAARGVGAVKAADILGRSPTTTPSSGRVPAKWRWHYRVLLALHSRLLRERGELLRAAAEPLEPHSLDEADSATDEFDHDLALAQLSAEQDALYEVNDALERILNGTYGVCEETSEAIPAARLKAIPWARFTRTVEERLEQQGVVRRARLREAATVRESGQVRLDSKEEDVAEKPSNDEALPHVFSPPGHTVAPHKSMRRPRMAANRKDTST